MDEILKFFTESSTLAFIVTIVIFAITLLLVIKRSIGFFITLLLLIFALVSGFFVANQDLLRGIIKSFSKENTGEKQDAYLLFKQQLEKSYGEMKEELIQQKKEFQEVFEKVRQQDPEHKEEKASK